MRGRGREEEREGEREREGEGGRGGRKRGEGGREGGREKERGSGGGASTCEEICSSGGVCAGVGCGPLSVCLSAHIHRPIITGLPVLEEEVRREGKRGREEGTCVERGKEERKEGGRGREGD